MLSASIVLLSKISRSRRFARPGKREKTLESTPQRHHRGRKTAFCAPARKVWHALERAHQFSANYLRLPSGGSVEVNRDFEGLLTEAPVMSAFAQLVHEWLGVPFETIKYVQGDTGQVSMGRGTSGEEQAHAEEEAALRAADDDDGVRVVAGEQLHAGGRAGLPAARG